MLDLNYNIIRRLLVYAEEIGYSPEVICATAGLDYTVISDPENTLTDLQIEHLWQATIEITGESEIGYLLGLNINMEALGLLGMLIQSASTTQQAIEMAVNYIPIATKLIKISLIEDTEHFTVTIMPADRLLLFKYPNRVQQVCLMTLAFMMKIHSLLTLKPVSRVEVGLPAHVKNRNIAKTHLKKFATLTDGVYFTRLHTRFLKEKIISSDFKALQTLRKRALSILSQKRKPYTRRVESIIINQFNGRFITLAELSDQMNMGTRTLQRQLKKEGTNFNTLLNNIKKMIAITYLRETKNISETAVGLGFTDTSSFGKTFKKWTGTSPARFIAQGIDKN